MLLSAGVTGCGGAAASPTAPAAAGSPRADGDGTSDGSAPRAGSPIELRWSDVTFEGTEDRVDAVAALGETERTLVQGDVAERREGRHGALPPVERAADQADLGPDAWPKVEVVNQTPHRLVVWFAGPCPRTVGLAPRQRFEVEVCAGGYDIAAQLDHPEFLPFVGEGDQVDDGYRYRLTFYVVSEPGRRGPGRLRRRGGR